VDLAIELYVPGAGAMKVAVFISVRTMRPLTDGCPMRFSFRRWTRSLDSFLTDRPGAATLTAAVSRPAGLLDRPGAGDRWHPGTGIMGRAIWERHPRAFCAARGLAI